MSDVIGIPGAPIETVETPTAGSDPQAPTAPLVAEPLQGIGGGIDSGNALGVAGAAAQDLATLQIGLLVIGASMQGNTSAFNSVNSVLEDAGNASLN